MNATDTIFINGLEFYAYHGASDAEQSVGHRYLVDVRLTVDTRAAAASDHLSDTVNYAAVANRIVQIGTSSQRRLLEALAGQMVAALFAEFPSVQQVQLRIHKMYPPMNSIAASVGVEITRSRHTAK